MRRWLMLFLILLLGGLGWLAFAFLSWREGKIAMLDPPPVVAQASTPIPADPPGMLLFGDSRIAQWQPAPDRPYPIILEGHPGQTAIRLLPRFAAVLAEDRPSAVILQLGVNDAVAASVVSAQRRERALQDSLDAFESMAALAQANGVDLTILAVIPPIRPDLKRRILFRGEVDAYLAALNAALPGIAARHGARFVNPMPLLRDAEGDVPDTFRRDSLHLTPDAYAALEPLVPAALPKRVSAALPGGDAG